MPIQLASSHQGEGTAEKQIINKALAYLFTPGQDPGELHEINALLSAYRGKIFIDGAQCSLRDETYFSRQRWTPTNDFASIPIQDLRDCLPPALGQDAKVKYGDNEIDLILIRNGDWVVIECKSGGASSSGSQTNSYVEALLERSYGGHASYFAYCYDSTTSEHEYYSFFHKIFASIKACRQGINPNAVNYFGQFDFNNPGTPKTDLAVVIHQFIRDNNITTPIVGDYSTINLLNDVLAQKAGFRLHKFHVDKSSKKNVRDAVIKLIRQNYLDPYFGNKPAFWLHMYLALEGAQF